ncbi:MAG: hypothetical protein ACRYF2_22675 [Janthinobacterium lividum]
MAEIVSDDVLDWARDLAEIKKLFGNEDRQQPVAYQPAAIVEFAPRQLLPDPLRRKMEIADQWRLQSD